MPIRLHLLLLLLLLWLLLLLCCCRCYHCTRLWPRVAWLPAPLVCGGWLLCTLWPWHQQQWWTTPDHHLPAQPSAKPTPTQPSSQSSPTHSATAIAQHLPLRYRPQQCYRLLLKPQRAS
jgi:hypothetical protein